MLFKKAEGGGWHFMSAPFSDDCIKSFSFSYLSGYFFPYIATISSANIRKK